MVKEEKKSVCRDKLEEKIQRITPCIPWEVGLVNVVLLFLTSEVADLLFGVDRQS